MYEVVYLDISLFFLFFHCFVMCCLWLYLAHIFLFIFLIATNFFPLPIPPFSQVFSLFYMTNCFLWNYVMFFEYKSCYVMCTPSPWTKRKNDFRRYLLFLTFLAFSRFSFRLPWASHPHASTIQSSSSPPFLPIYLYASSFFMHPYLPTPKDSCFSFSIFLAFPFFAFLELVVKPVTQRPTPPYLSSTFLLYDPFFILQPSPRKMKGDNSTLFLPPSPFRPCILQLHAIR